MRPHGFTPFFEALQGFFYSLSPGNSQLFTGNPQYDVVLIDETTRYCGSQGDCACRKVKKSEINLFFKNLSFFNFCYFFVEAYLCFEVFISKYLKCIRIF